MACENKDSAITEVMELIGSEGFAGLGKALQILFNEAMKLERERYLQAQLHERTQSRQGYANGYKPKTVSTRLGQLELAIPQVREGNFYPSALEKGIRSERALKLALAEMYIQGVSTRKVAAITQELCGFEVSSSQVSQATQRLDEELAHWRNRPLGRSLFLILDARYEKVREGGCVVDSAVLIAYGIDTQGKRSVLGVSVSLSEHEVHWRRFLHSLVERGLHGVGLITSDAHSGLKAARQAVFPSIPWQRCQFHLQQNAQAYVTKQVAKQDVASAIRSIFNAPSRAEAERLLQLTQEEYQAVMPKLANWMQENLTEGLTVFEFPQAHRRRLRTSNMAERVNKEIYRRTKVATIFPNTASCERLVTAILMEISEEWETGKSYLSMAE